MRIAQTIDEVGLENRAIAIWSEPRAGQRLKPRFGSRRFPMKPLYAIIIFVGYFSFRAVAHETAASFQEIVLYPIVAVAIAWPLIVALDRLTRRNVWIYPDRILVTHARDRIVLPKSEIKQVYLYRMDSSTALALEFLTVKGKSTVVALPLEATASETLTGLRKCGYVVQDDATGAGT